MSWSKTICHPVGLGVRMHQLHLCRGVRLPQMGLPVGRGWRPVMLKDRTQVVEHSMTCNTPLWLFLGLDGRSERPPPINRLVTSSPSTYMIAPTLLPLWQPPTLFIIWVLEGGGCGSKCPGNDVKLYLMVRLQFWRSGECGVPLHHHFPLVQSDPEW